MQIGIVGLGRMGDNMAPRTLSAMRLKFGGHVEPPSGG